MKCLPIAALFICVFLLEPQIVTNYQVVSPVVTFKSDDLSAKSHPSKLEVIVGRNLLHLELNSGLFPAHFTSRHYDENNNEIIERGHVNCFYQGRVDGHPDWRVTISTCHGLQGSFGDLSNKQQYFHIEPIERHSDSLEVPHALYLATEYNISRGNCGSQHHHNGGQGTILSSSSIAVPDMELARSRLRRQTENGFLIVEWALVNDNRQYQRFGENLTATVSRSLEITNFVDMLYQDLNIRVVLVDVTTWTSGDQINVVSDPNTLLDNFESYKPQITAQHDSAMLITGIDIAGNTVGIAFVGTMCSRLSSVGLSQDRSSGVDSVGSTAAHELGHIFNMAHDDGQRTCTCNDPSGSCIMASVSGFPSPTQWSDCSRSDLSTGFSNRNLDRCLFNEPTMTIGDPVCGNGIRERDEICDCGSPEECRNPCCNATTCTLADSADCGEGQCCENCQFRAYGTTCREPMGECDTLEYCSGDSPDCPADLHIQDGQSCSNNQSYCFSGLCRSHDQQCRLHWGAAAFQHYGIVRFKSGNQALGDCCQFRAYGTTCRSNMAVQQCYDVYNIQADEFGNCGYSGSAFVACSAEDVLCGQLQCDSGTFQRQVNIGVNILTGRVRVNGRIEDCRSFSPLSPPTDTMHPGLVEDGTRCGDNRLCFMRQCVEISSLTNIQPCPIGTNGETCSGNGVCNNLNQCSCSVGFNGDACQSVFTGPGTGQPTRGNNAGVIAGAVIGTLLGLALLAGVIVGIVVLIVMLKPRKKYKYTPPTQADGTNSSSRTIQLSTTYKKVADRSPDSTPSVNVVRPVKYNAGQRAPHGSSTPSAPVRTGAGSNRPPPPSRPNPPKPLSYAPPPLTKAYTPAPPYASSSSHRPPAIKPAPAPRYPVPSAAKPPPPVLAQKPQVTPKPGKVQGRWPPVDSSAPAKPTPPPKKPIIPPR